MSLERLPIFYEIKKTDVIRNPFYVRTGKFDDPFFEFVDICLDNLTFAAYTLLMWQGKPLQLAPFQSVVLETLWNTTFPMLLATRGGAKSFMLAVYAVMRAMLTPGSKVVIVGAGFRQSKIIFDYIEQLYNYSPLLRACCPDGIRKSPDKISLKVGESVIIAIPLGNGDKIRGLRACVSGDTLIETDRGLLPIQKIVEQQANIKVWNGKKYILPQFYIRTPIVDVHEVITKYGIKIQFSDIHMIMTKNGWKDINELKVGDKIDLYASQKFADSYVVSPEYSKFNIKKNDFFIPERINEDIGKMLGYLVSEGLANHKVVMSVNFTDKALFDDFIQTYLNCFGVQPKVYTRDAYVDKRGWNCKESWYANLYRIGVRNYLYEIGLGYDKARFKYIPWCIFQSPKSVIKAFLSALFDGDGTACIYSDKRRQASRLFYVVYYSASEQLCREIQQLLLKFGIQSSLSQRAGDKGKQFYVRMNGYWGLKFVKEIGFKHNSSRVEVCRRAEEILPYKEPKWLPVPIKSIKKNIKKDVLYDFTIPDGKCFVGNGILNHNTHVLADEFASINPEVFQVVIRGFVAVAANPIEAATQTYMEKQMVADGFGNYIDKGRKQGNQIVYSGTASYQFNHFYKTYMTHKAIIENKIQGSGKDVGSKLLLTEDDALAASYLDYRDYAIVRIPYQCLPESFMDEKQIAQARITMPRSLFSMEYECVFATDSDGFFKRSLINTATPGNKECGGVAFPIEIRGVAGCEYVMGIDPARRTDNFSISILKLNKENETYKNVYCYSMNGKSYPKAVTKIRELLSRFDIVRIAMDAGGGGTAVEDLLQDESRLKIGEQCIWRHNEPEHRKFPGKHILEIVNFTPTWISDANYSMASDIEHKRLLFPCKTMDTAASLQENELFLEEEETWCEIDDQITEICTIVVTSTKTGIQHFDTPDTPLAQQGVLKTHQRKDRYSALLLATYAARTYLSDGRKHVVIPNIGGWVDCL